MVRDKDNRQLGVAGTGGDSVGDGVGGPKQWPQTGWK